MVMRRCIGRCLVVIMVVVTVVVVVVMVMAVHLTLDLTLHHAVTATAVSARSGRTALVVMLPMTHRRCDIMTSFTTARFLLLQHVQHLSKLLRVRRGIVLWFPVVRFVRLAAGVIGQQGRHRIGHLTRQRFPRALLRGFRTAPSTIAAVVVPGFEEFRQQVLRLVEVFLQVGDGFVGETDLYRNMRQGLCSQ